MLFRSHKAIVDEVLRANVPHRDLDELNYYAEMHIPTRKHMLDDNGQRRKPHLHVAVSLLDHKTQKKLEFYNPNDLSYHSAVQSEINARYGFLIQSRLWRETQSNKLTELHL